jgi:hypothetical protein
MHEGGVNKLETRVQILKLFQGVDLVLLTKIWHFPGQHLPHIERCDSLAVAHIMQLGKTKVIKHNRGVIAYFRSHLNPNLSQCKEGSHDFYLWIWVSKGAAPNLFVYVVYAALVGSKHKSESLFQNLVADIAEVQIIGGIVLLGRILMCVPNNQVLWLSDRTVTPVLAARAASSWTYVVTLGCSSLMAGQLVTNQGSSLIWQMGGATLSIILLAHLQFSKSLHPSR